MGETTKKKIKEIESLLQVTRIDILTLLLKEDTCACQIVKKLNLKNNLISHHLKTLQDMGYISSTKNGTHVIYKLNDSKRKTVKILFNILK